MSRSPPHTRARSSSLNHTLVDMPSREESDRAYALLSLSIALIDSALDILTLHLSADDQLTRESLLMPGGTLGKHFRHVIESFQAFTLPLKAESSNDGPLEINYDAIVPSSRRPIARELEACQRAMREVRDDLSDWGERVSSRADQQRESASGGDGSGSGIPGPGVAGEVTLARRNGLAAEMERKVVVVAITPTRQEMTSSLGRELWYCSLHAIHHFSMLRTIAVHEHGLELPVEFGTAPSTLLYRGLGWKPPAEKKEIRVIKAKL